MTLLAGWSDSAVNAIGRAFDAAQSMAASGKPVAAFDCDMTTVYGETGWTVFNYMVDSMSFKFGEDFYTHVGERYGAAAIAKCVDTLLPLSQSERQSHPLFQQYRRLMLGANYDRYRNKGGAMSCPWVVGSYAGIEQSTLETITRNAIERALYSPYRKEIVPGASIGLPDLEISHGICLFPAVVNLMSLLKAAGFDVVMVSGSHQLAVETLANLLDMPVDRSFGMDPVVKGGVVTTEVKDPWPWQSGKSEVIRQHYPNGHSLAFGDSAGDVNLLGDATEAAVLIDHGDESLRERAVSSGWSVQAARPWIEEF